MLCHMQTVCCRILGVRARVVKNWWVGNASSFEASWTYMYMLHRSCLDSYPSTVDCQERRCWSHSDPLQNSLRIIIVYLYRLVKDPLKVEPGDLQACVRKCSTLPLSRILQIVPN